MKSCTGRDLLRKNNGQKPALFARPGACLDDASQMHERPRALCSPHPGLHMTRHTRRVRQSTTLPTGRVSKGGPHLLAGRERDLHALPEVHGVQHHGAQHLHLLGRAEQQRAPGVRVHLVAPAHQHPPSDPSAHRTSLQGCRSRWPSWRNGVCFDVHLRRGR